MANGKGLLVWLAGGAGVFLLYSAVSNKTPLSLLQSYLGGGAATPFPTASGSSGPQVSSGFTQEPWTGSVGGQPTPPSLRTPLKPGQTYDTGPNGNYLPGTGNQLGSYGGSGVYDLIDANGNNMGAIPQAYQNNPNAFVPPPGGSVINA